jgi:hypothetical protein
MKLSAPCSGMRSSLFQRHRRLFAPCRLERMVVAAGRTRRQDSRLVTWTLAGFLRRPDRRSQLLGGAPKAPARSAYATARCKAAKPDVKFASLGNLSNETLYASPASHAGGSGAGRELPLQTLALLSALSFLPAANCVSVPSALWPGTCSHPGGATRPSPPTLLRVRVPNADQHAT